MKLPSNQWKASAISIVVGSIVGGIAPVIPFLLATVVPDVILKNLQFSSFFSAILVVHIIGLFFYLLINVLCARFILKNIEIKTKAISPILIFSFSIIVIDFIIEIARNGVTTEIFISIIPNLILLSIGQLMGLFLSPRAKNQ